MLSQMPIKCSCFSFFFFQLILFIILLFLQLCFRLHIWRGTECARARKLSLSLATPPMIMLLFLLYCKNRLAGVAGTVGGTTALAHFISLTVPSSDNEKSSEAIVFFFRHFSSAARCSMPWNANTAFFFRTFNRRFQTLQCICEQSNRL